MKSERAVGPRVLHIATSQNDGGIERYSVRLASGLARNGVWSSYACLPGAIVDRLCREANVPTLPLAVRNSGDMQAVRQIAAHIASRSIDLVHVHSRRDYLPALLGVALARRQAHQGLAEPKLVLHAHMLRPLGTPTGLSGRIFAHGADRVLAVSEAVQHALGAGAALPPGFVQVLHNGVDLDRFRLPLSASAQRWRADCRREWGLRAEDLIVTMVGRLDAKGQAGMLDALSLLGPGSPVRLVLAGSEGRAGTRAALQQRVRASGINARVVFAGPREDVPQVLAASDILAHLPTDEAFGLALAEAMGAGLPTIASQIGGCREVVQEGVTGLLVPSGNAPALADALRRLTLGPAAPALRAHMGEAGRARAEREFSLPRQVRRLEEIYGELCPHLEVRAAPPSVRLSRS